MRARAHWAAVFLASFFGCSDDDCPAGAVRMDGRCVHVDDRDGGPGDDGGRPLCDAGVVTGFQDLDEDGYGDDGTAAESCGLPEGLVDVGGDCDDRVAAIHPDAPELCNGLDDDCSAGADDPFDCVQGGSVSCRTECGSEGSVQCSAACTIPPVCPIPEETCNYMDDDCDGIVDEDLETLLGEPLEIGQDGDRVTVATALVLADGLGVLTCDDNVTRLTTINARSEVVLFREPLVPSLDGYLTLCIGLVAAMFDDRLVVSVKAQPEAGGPHSSLVFSVDPVSATVDEVALFPGREGAYVGGLAEFFKVGESLLSLSFHYYDEGGEGVRVWTHTADGAPQDELLLIDGPWASDASVTRAGNEVTIALGYRDEGRFDLLRFDEDGAMTVGPTTVVLEGHEPFYAAISESSAGALLVASTDGSLGPLYAVPTDPALEPGEPVPLGNGVVRPGGVASAGQDFVVIRTTAAGPEYLRVGADGTTLDGPHFLGDSVPQTRVGQVVWTGTRYELLWATDSGGGYARVMLQGYGCE